MSKHTPEALFAAHTQEHAIADEAVESMRHTERILHVGMATVRDTTQLNSRFLAYQRSDLVILEKADLDQPPSVTAMSERPFASFSTHFGSTNNSLIGTAAFSRALHLFPNEVLEFAVLVEDTPYPSVKLAPQLFAAYSILSQLVDVADPDVTDAAGHVDPTYLYRR